MAKILLEGDAVFEFIPDRTKLTEELEARSASARRGPLRIPGKFSLCDSVNGNNRRYPQKVWEKNLQAGSPLMETIAKKRSLGLLEHPKEGVVSLNSPISHLVTAVSMEGKEINGEITLLGTAEGLKMTALVEAGYNPYVSSRGYGSVIRASDGVDDVQDDFICEAWDLVASPSFKIAELQPNRESLTAPVAGKVTEGTTAPLPAVLPLTKETPEQLFSRINALVNEGKIKANSVKLVNGIVVLEGELLPTISIPEQTPVPTAIKTRDTMDIKTIRESVSALRNIDVSKLTPGRLAEGLTQMQNLHRETAGIVAQDAKMSYDGRVVDQDISDLEKAWTESAQAPAATVTKLQEQQTRTIKVLKAVCETGIKYRTKLTETIKTLTSKEKVLTEVGKRGNNWRLRALTSESKSKIREGHLSLAYASLDEFARRYHEDTTKLAKHALMLEHKAKIEADAGLLKRVNEANRVETLISIKEEITGVKAPLTETAPKTVPSPSSAPAPSATKVPAPAQGTVRVESFVRPFSVSQLTECTARLSQASALVG